MKSVNFIIDLYVSYYSLISRIKKELILKRNIVFLLCCIFVVGCASTKMTTIIYSGSFKIEFPTKSLVKAKILSIDGPSIKFYNNSTISGLIITKELESLPLSFDLHDYPSYALGLKSTEKLPEILQNKFLNSSDEIRRNYKSPHVFYNDNGKDIYMACNIDSCIEFVVNKDVTDQILMITTYGFTQEQLLEITKGI